MRGLDTHVLLRPIARDDLSQAATVEAFLRDVQAEGERLHVSGIVLCEMCRALRGYGFSRSDIADTLEKVLATGLFEIQDRDLEVNPPQLTAGGSRTRTRSEAVPSAWRKTPPV